MSRPGFGVSKVIRIGTHKSWEDLIRDTEKAGCVISRSSKELATEVPLAPVETRITLMVARISDINLPQDSITGAYDRCERIGLFKLSAEVAFQLRLQYLDQPFDEVLQVAMDPLVNGHVLSVSHKRIAIGGERRLVVDFGYGYPDIRFPDDIWVFGTRYTRMKLLAER